MQWDSCPIITGRATTCVIVRSLKTHHFDDAKRIAQTVWSNFEIADMDFWRGEAYSAYFEHLYKSGGFYYEVGILIVFCASHTLIHVSKRWGDAPVHSIAASLFLPRDKLHFFSDIGYRHTAYTHCPQGKEHSQGKCSCNKADNFG